MTAARGSGSASNATSPPPKTFRFMHITGSIIPSTQEELSNNLGEWDIRFAAIRYDAGADRNVQRETVLHEMLHVILEHTDIEPKKHEDIIRAVSPLLLEMLSKNPKLLGWLVG